MATYRAIEGSAEFGRRPNLVVVQGPAVEFRTRTIISQPGGLVHIRETLECQPPRYEQELTQIEYWFAVPPKGVTMPDAYPRFASLFKEGIPRLKTSGLANPPEPQLYLLTDRWGQPLTPTSVFKDAAEAMQTGQYVERYNW